MNIENDVRLIGNLGNDPEVKYTQGGMAITRVSLATTSKRKDRDGNQSEETQWHRVVFFGKLAEIAGEYLRKGSKIAVAGMIRYGKYDKDGVTHYTTEIIVSEMKMLNSTQRSDEQAKRKQAPPPATTDFNDSEGFDDDDIPF